jgi:hypothetical protein
MSTSSSLSNLYEQAGLSIETELGRSASAPAGPGYYCSPRHRMLFTSKKRGFKVPVNDIASIIRRALVPGASRGGHEPAAVDWARARARWGGADRPYETPKLKPPGAERLKLKYDGLLSRFAFNLNLRRHSSARSSRAVARSKASAARRG